MSNLISPWFNDSFRLPSPDGKWTAIFENHGEIRMRGPSFGTLRIEPWSMAAEWRMCNPSMIWSDDSNYLAIPQWTMGESQRLLLISTVLHGIMYSKDVYRILELQSFSDGVLRGIHSPVQEPHNFLIDVNHFDWNRG